MQNQNDPKQKKSAENLDASKMSGAALLEAIGISESLPNSLVRENNQKSTAAPEQTDLPQPESDMQKRIAEIQRQKMQKIREALAAQHEQETDSSEHVSEPAETVAVSEPNASSGGTAVALAERPEPDSADDVSEPDSPVEEVEPAEEDEEDEEDNEDTQEIESVSSEPEPEPEKPVKKVSSPKPKKKKKKKKKRKLNQRNSLFIGTGCASVLIIAYFIGALSYQGKFLPRTYINSLSVAGMTTEEAHDALIQAKEIKDLTLVTPKGEEAVFAASDFKAAYEIPSGALNEAASESNFTWFSKLFRSSEYAVKYDYTYSEEDLRNLIQNYDWGNEVSQNAKIIRSNSGDFTIQPETLGDKFDIDTLLNYIMEQLSSGKNIINMEDSGCYENYRAKVKATDLEDDVEVYNRYAKCSITFDFEDRKKVVDNDMVISWLMTKEDGSFVTTSGHVIPLNQDAIAEFVAQMAEETDTYGKDREFYSTLDGWITVPWTSSSMYGWKIDQNATVNQIMELIDKGESVTVEPIYAEKGMTRQTDDIGTTYIDVDISAQHFWYYKNNELLMDYDIVSGLEVDPSRRTPRGIFKILRHANGATLGSYAVEGYEQWVDYWMPFTWDGCGFHDLSRGSYGGSVYMYNGSHGCLNMRWSEAKNLYENIEDNIPVIVHD